MPDNQTDLEVQDDSLETPAVDKTTEKNEEKNNLDDLPSEDDDLDGDKDPGAKTKVVDKAEIAQKIKWRGKAMKLESEVAELTKQLEQSKQRVQDNGGNPDEKEKAAQQYIRDQAKAAYAEVRLLEKQEEARTVREFETKVENVLEDNPEVTEQELLDVVEELEVDPETAMKILKRNQENKKPKPKMPQARRGSPEVRKETSKTEPGQKKNLWQIAQDVKSQLKNLKQ